VTGLRHRAAAKALRLRNQANQKHPDRTLCRARQPVRVLKISGLRVPLRSPEVTPGKHPDDSIWTALGCGPSAVVGAHNEHSVVAPGDQARAPFAVCTRTDHLGGSTYPNLRPSCQSWVHLLRKSCRQAVCGRPCSPTAERSGSMVRMRCTSDDMSV
jgi:hypothetical protein